MWMCYITSYVRYLNKQARMILHKIKLHFDGQLFVLPGLKHMMSFPCSHSVVMHQESTGQQSNL